MEFTYTILFTSNISQTWQRAINKSNTITQFDAAKSSQTRLTPAGSEGQLLFTCLPYWACSCPFEFCSILSASIQLLIRKLRLSPSDCLHFCKGTLLAQHDSSLLPRILRKRAWFSFYFPHWEKQHFTFFFEEIVLLVCLLYWNQIKSFIFHPWFPFERFARSFFFFFVAIVEAPYHTLPCTTLLNLNSVHPPPLSAPCSASAETSPASHGVGSARPSRFSCFSLKLPFQKMARSAPLEVGRVQSPEENSDVWTWEQFGCWQCASFAQSATIWPSRLCAQRAAWYEEYSPITASVRYRVQLSTGDFERSGQIMWN